MRASGLGVILYLCLSAAASAESLFDGGLSEREKALAREGDSVIVTATVLLLDIINGSADLGSLKPGDCQAALVFEKKAQEGIPLFQYALSILYRRGICVPKDSKAHVRWASAAAQAGEPEAQYALATAYLRGDGIENSPTEAVHWLNKAFASGNLNAGKLLALVYLDGEGVPKDVDRGISLLIKVADAGSDDAAGQLGLRYKIGSLPRREQEVLSVVNAAANRGNAEAQLALGILLTQMRPVLVENLTEAYTWFNLASGSPDRELAAGSAEMRDFTEKLLSPSQIAEAQAQTRAFTPAPAPRKKRSYSDLPEVGDFVADTMGEAEARKELASYGLLQEKEAFIEAAKTDNLGLFKLFHKAGADLETTWTVHRLTPLYFATDYESHKVFSYLLAQGADVNAVNVSNGSSPLLRAISHDRPEMIEALLAHGASARQRPEFEGNATPLSYVLLGDDLRLLTRVLDSGASPNEIYENGTTPLMSAACKSDAMFKTLVDRGGDVGAHNQFGSHVLDHVLGCGTVSLMKLRLLLKNGVKVASPSDRPGPLGLAVIGGNAEAVTELVKAGANPDVRYRLKSDDVPFVLDGASKEVMMNGGTALLLATELGHASAVAALVAVGARDDVVVRVGGVPLTALGLAQRKKNRLMEGILSGAWGATVKVAGENK